MTVLYRPVSYIECLNLPNIFQTPQPLEVELGAGDGSFLIDWAKANPRHNFLAVERLLGAGAIRLRACAEHGEYWVVMQDPEGNEFCLQ